MKKRKSILISKQVRYYSIVFAVVILSFYTSFYYYIVSTSEKISLLAQAELADKTIKQVEYYLEDIDHVAYQVMNHSQILNTFHALQADKRSTNSFDENLLDRIDIGSTLTTVNGPQKLMSRIGVYNQYGDFVYAGTLIDKEKTYSILNLQDVEQEMADLMGMKDKYKIVANEKDKWTEDHSKEYVTIRRPLMNIYSKEVYGVVEVQQDLEKLANNIALDVMDFRGITLKDENDAEILNIQDESIEGEKCSYVSTSSQKYGWTVTLAQSRKGMLAPYNRLILIIFVGCFAILMLLIGITTMIARRLSEPVILLKETVDKLSIQNLDAHYETTTKMDEVRELDYAFSAMLSRLSESIALERKASLLALQAQMNPHFLYNSLSTISAAGVEEGNPKVVKMCQELSAMLRYIASYEETTVTLREELAHVNSYLQFMKWRYEDYFNYEIEADEELLSMPIPKLTLQPLAENSFAHGFSAIEPPYHVKILAQIREGEWSISICDNGQGLEDAAKKNIKDKIALYWQDSSKYTELKIGGLGLINTLIRIKLNTGEDITYSIEDNKPRGLIVTMKGVVG